MKSVRLYLLVIISIVEIEGQDLKVRGTVYNSVTRDTILYGTIQKTNSKVYRDADEFGRFKIEVSAKDSLIISSIGFETSFVDLLSYRNTGTFFLKPSVVNSPEIVVPKPTTQTFGIINEKVDRTCSGGSLQTRYEVATLVDIPVDVQFYRISKGLIRGRISRRKTFFDSTYTRLTVTDYQAKNSLLKMLSSQVTKRVEKLMKLMFEVKI